VSLSVFALQSLVWAQCAQLARVQLQVLDVLDEAPKVLVDQ
jgi:hypothetical protein